jgi:hypothetical protein
MKNWSPILQPTQNYQRNDWWPSSQCVRLLCPVLTMFTAAHSSLSHQDGLAVLPTSSSAAVANLPKFDVPYFTPNKYQNGPTNNTLHESQNAQWKETKVSHNRCKGINTFLLTILCPSTGGGTICIYSGKLLCSTSETFNMDWFCFVLNRLCHGTYGYSPNSHCGDSGSIPGRCMWGS